MGIEGMGIDGAMRVARALSLALLLVYGGIGVGESAEAEAHAQEVTATDHTITTEGIRAAFSEQAPELKNHAIQSQASAAKKAADAADAKAEDSASNKKAADADAEDLKLENQKLKSALALQEAETIAKLRMKDEALRMKDKTIAKLMQRATKAEKQLKETTTRVLGEASAAAVQNVLSSKVAASTTKSADQKKLDEQQAEIHR